MTATLSEAEAASATGPATVAPLVGAVSAVSGAARSTTMPVSPHALTTAAASALPAP